MQPAPPTSTQGYRSKHHGIEVTPPFVGRTGASEKLGSTPQTTDYHSTIIVRVLGSLGDVGLYRESLGEDVKVKTKPVIAESEEEGSPQTRKMKESTDYQSLGGSNNQKMKE